MIIFYDLTNNNNNNIHIHVYYNILCCVML